MPYKLPNNLEPEGVQCIKIYVPDDVEWRSLFWGTFSELARWFNYERDGTEHGAQVARLWRTLYLQSEAEFIETGGCGLMDVRVKPDDSCILQKSSDGETWEDWANLDDCGAKIRVNPATCLVEVDCGDDNWQPVYTPALDPSQDLTPPVPYPDPPPPGQDNTCLAAANTTPMLQNGATNFTNLVALDSLLGEIVSMLYEFLASVVTVTLSQLWLGLGVAYGDLNPATIEADLAEFDWDELRCILYEYYEDDGTITAINWATVLDIMQDKISSSGNQIWIVLALVWGLMGTYGAAFATHWANITEADCSDCTGWTHCWNAENGWDGWAARDAGEGIVSGGALHNDAYQRIVMNVTIPQTVVRTFSMTYSASGSASGFQQVQIQLFDDGTGTAAPTWANDLGTDISVTFTYDIDDPREGDLLQVNVWLSDVIEITEVCIGGDGADPFS